MIITKCIPLMLREHPYWCAWRPVKKPNGNVERVPVSCNGSPAKCNDPNTCHTFDEALAFLDSHPECGLNVLVTSEGPSVFDFDECVSSDGIIAPEVEAVLEQLGETYVEYSPSGRGLHAWVRTPPETRNLVKASEGFEFFAGKHFMSVTGNALEPGRAPEIAEIGSETPREHYRLFTATKHQEATDEPPEASHVEPPEETEEPVAESSPPGDESDERSPRVLATERCLDALSDERASDYHAWIRIMCALKSVEAETGEDLRELWHRFSRRCADKYDPDKTDEKWDTFEPLENEEERATFGSLLHDAEEDSGKSRDELCGTFRVKTPKEDAGDERLPFMTCSELDGGDFTLEYLIPEILVAGQPAVLVGPQKSLKTSILIDLAISLSTREYFLGRFPVSRTIRVGVCSGESGLANLQDTARRVCQAKGIELAGNDKLFWSEELPIFGNSQWMKILERKIRDHGLELLAVDPAYLSMTSLSENANNFFATGPLLRSVNEVVAGAGCQLLLAHHSPPSKLHYEPPKLTDAAWSGWSEWARQWLLLNRREAYNADSAGEHALWLSFGGSAGHSSLWGLDVEEGRRADPGGRRWDVEILSPGEIQERKDERQEEAKQRKEAQAAEDRRQKVLEVLREHPDGLTERRLRELAGVNSANFAQAADVLLKDGLIASCTIKNDRKNQTYEGYKLT